MRFILSCFLIVNTFLLAAQPVCYNQNRYIDSVFSQVDITNNIWFGNADPFNPFSSNQDLYLDFYEPHGDTASARPLIIHAFGGGFLNGDRTSDDIPYWADQYVKKGYVFVSIDYRLGYNPASASSVERAAYRCAQDYNAALRFLADNANTYRIDLDNVIVTGNSAGSIGALIVAFMDDNDRPASTYGTTLEGSDLGCFNCSGNSNYNNEQVPIKGCINLWGAMLDTSFINLTTNSADNIPTISFHGDDDSSVPYDVGHPYSLPFFPMVYGSYPVHLKLNEQNIPNELVTFPGFPHEPEQTYPWVSDTIVSKASKFMYPFIYGDSAKIIADNSICADSILTISAQYHNGSSYCWNVPNATILNDSAHTITLSFNSMGSFMAYLTETDYKGLSKTDSVAIQVNYPPQSALAVNGQNGLLSLTLLNTNITQAYWNFGNGNTSNILQPTHQFLDTGYVNIQTTITDEYCSADTSYWVLSNKCPDVSYSYEIKDSTLYLYSTATLSTHAYWVDFEGSVFYGDTLIYPLENEDDFPFILYASNSYCSDSLQDNLAIHFCANAAFNYSINNSQVNFNDESYNAYFYTWNFGDGATSGVPNPSHFYSDTGIYTVQLIVTSIAGCSDTLYKEIHVSGINTSVYNIENSLSIYPNPTNGLIHIDGLSNFTNVKITVFNYLGKLIYSSGANFNETILLNEKKGIYFIKISSKEQQIVYRVVRK